MKTTQAEISYHDLKFDFEKLEKARKFCDEVSKTYQNFFKVFCVFLFQHQPCIYDFLSTENEQFANYTKKDFPGKFIYIGDIF